MVGAVVLWIAVTHLNTRLSDLQGMWFTAHSMRNTRMSPLKIESKKKLKKKCKSFQEFGKEKTALSSVNHWHIMPKYN